MKAAVYTQGSGFQIADMPIPDIWDDELLVRVGASSICGTDVRIIKNGHRKLADGQKVILGHEFSGTVEKSGSRANSFPVGTRVGVAPNMGCGQCEQCIRGRYNMCPDYTAFGITLDGAHTEFVRIPHAAIGQGSVVELPDAISFREASVIEPLSCAVNGSRACDIQLGDVVVIYGAGPIGLLHVALAMLQGAALCIVADIEPAKLDAAKDFGAGIVIDSREEDVRDRVMSETGRRGADVVITACSVASVQEAAFGLLAPYGRVCLFGGLPKDASYVNLDSNAVHYKNLVVTGVTGGSPYDFRTAMKLVQYKRIDVGKVISHTFPADEMDQAFDVACGGQAGKVVISHDR